MISKVNDTTKPRIKAMFIKSVLNTLILSSCFFAGAYGSPVSIKSMYAEALEFDQDLQNARGTVEQAKGNYVENLYAFLPAPLISYSSERIETTFANGRERISHPAAFDLIVIQSISAPKIFSTISSYDAVKGEEADYFENHGRLIYAILFEHAKILSAYEGLKSLETTSEQLKKIYDNELVLLKQRNTTQANVDLAKTTYESSLNDQLALRKSIFSNINTLYRLTGKFYTRLPALPQNNDAILAIKTKSLPNYENIALKQNGNVIGSRYKINAQRNQMRATRGNFLPYLSYTVLYNKNENQSSDIVLVDDTLLTSIGVTYNFGANPGTIVTQRGTLTRAIAKNRQVVAQTISSLHNSYQNLKNSQSNIKQYKTSIPSAEATVKAMEAQYKDKTIRLSELLNAIKHLQSLNQELANSRYGAVANYINLSVLAGEKPNTILKQLNPLLTGQVVLPKSS